MDDCPQPPYTWYIFPRWPRHHISTDWFVHPPGYHQSRRWWCSFTKHSINCGTLHPTLTWQWFSNRNNMFRPRGHTYVHTVRKPSRRMLIARSTWRLILGVWQLRIQLVSVWSLLFVSVMTDLWPWVMSRQVSSGCDNREPGQPPQWNSNHGWPARGWTITTCPE